MSEFIKKLAFEVTSRKLPQPLFTQEEIKETSRVLTSPTLNALTEQDLMQLLAHKLNMQDKMLALVEVKEHGLDKSVFTVRNPVAIISKDSAIITYGVGE